MINVFLNLVCAITLGNCRDSKKCFHKYIMFFHDTWTKELVPTVPPELPWELEELPKVPTVPTVPMELEELEKIYSSTNIAVNESVVAFFKKKVESVNPTSLLYFTK